jgi:hypothetical protein
MGPIREQTCQPDAKHCPIQPAHVCLALLRSGVEEGAVNSAIYLGETAKAPSERRLRGYHDSDIGLRTKNWQKQTATIGKQRLPENSPSFRLVEGADDEDSVRL